jgi:hypothetical protein
MTGAAHPSPVEPAAATIGVTAIRILGGDNLAAFPKVRGLHMFITFPWLFSENLFIESPRSPRQSAQGASA